MENETIAAITHSYPTIIMPLPRSAFSSNLKKTPLYTLSEEDEEESQDHRPKSANANKPTFLAEPKRVDNKKKTPSGSVFKSSDHSAFSSSSSSFNSSY